MNKIQELQARRTELVAKKQDIEAQLSNDKYEMLEDRAVLIEQGMDNRSAVIKASSAGDAEWRRRAIAALKITDRQLAQVNHEIKELGVEPKQSKKLWVQRVEVYNGTAEDLAAHLRKLCQLGHIRALTTVGNKTVIVYEVRE